MSEENEVLPAKRSKVADAEYVSSTASVVPTDEGNRRRQVDEHVQAFLKAVLDHAHVQKRKGLNSKGRNQVNKCDASTQTEESYLADDTGDTEAFEATESYNTNVSASVPNFEMYSQETRHIACQQGAYFSQARDELSADQQFTMRENYSTGVGEPALNSVASGSNKTSAGEIRRLINEWVQKYEQWFLQNFGVDIQTAYRDYHVVSQEPVATSTQSIDWNALTQPSRPTHVTSSSTDDPPSAVISRPPVKYVVSEGSLLVPEAGVSPYVSLIPSFYTPDAFQRTTHQPQLSLHSAPVYIQPQPQPQPFFVTPVPTSPTVTLVNQFQFLPSLNTPFVTSCSLTIPCSIQLPVAGIPTLPACTQPAVSSTVPAASIPTILPSCYPPTATVSTPAIPVSSGFSEDPDVTSTKITTESFADLSENFQTSAMLAALAMPLSSSNGQKQSVGRWGPPLRYGVYGRLPSASELQLMNPQGPDSNNKMSPVETDSTSSTDCAQKKPKMPPPPPTFILLRRQVMICALQLSCRDRGQELLLREKENVSGLPIDYPAELDRVVEKSIGVRPVYVFTRLADMPYSERRHFLDDGHRHQGSATTTTTTNNGWGVCHGMLDVNQRHRPLLDAASHVSQYARDGRPGPATAAYRQRPVYPAIRQRGGWQEQDRDQFFSPADMYCCDLLVGDVIVAQACATYRRQARVSVAKQAFRILAKPCFLVGSVRSWEEVDYLVLCLSRKAELVPKLSPFLTDPFESLKEDNDKNKKRSTTTRSLISSPHDQDFEVTNSKPIEDFWIYLAMYPLEALSTDQTLVERFLAQSGEFSQMTVSFEVETNFETGYFTCIGLVDAVKLGLATASTVSGAQRQTANQLLHSLVHSQPIVGLRMDAELAAKSAAYPWDPLWGVPEPVLVDALMWGKEERDLAIKIEQLEAHCEVPDFQGDAEETAVGRYRGAKMWSHRRLDHWLQAYAASALVTPVCLNQSLAPRSLWSFVRRSASNWGLLTQMRPGNTGLLICKRIPLPRLKSSLYTTGSFGCFQLVSKGDLSEAAIDRLLSADPVSRTCTGDSQPASPSSEPPAAVWPNGSWTASAEDGIHDDNDDTSYLDEPVTRLARHFLTTGGGTVVKQEPMDAKDQQWGRRAVAPPIGDCVLVTAELNQPSNAIEILDDLPRTLIPGIDF